MRFSKRPEGFKICCGFLIRNFLISSSKNKLLLLVNGKERKVVGCVLNKACLVLKSVLELERLVTFGQDGEGGAMYNVQCDHAILNKTHQSNLYY